MGGTYVALNGDVCCENSAYSGFYYFLRYTVYAFLISIGLGLFLKAKFCHMVLTDEGLMGVWSIPD